MSILEALGSAEESDLADVDSRIEELEAELGQLKTVRKILEAKFRPSRPTNTKRLKGEKTELASSIFDLISNEGPLPIEVIAARLGERKERVRGSVSRNPWFKKNKEGDIEIAKQG